MVPFHIKVARAVVALATLITLAGASPASAASPLDDPFYHYSGATPLAEIAPGTVLKTRTTKYHVWDQPLQFDAVQILYRTTDALGRPTVNATSVIKPLTGPTTPRVIGYGSHYDSLDPLDEPSLAIAGKMHWTAGGAMIAAESVRIRMLLDKGFTVAIADSEGQRASFMAGPEYGMATLDGLRAAFAAPETNLGADVKVALMGYSGGGVAASWAAEMAPRYAPDINTRLVGASYGGALVHPGNALEYVDGAPNWAGVLPMSIAGIARAYDLDLTPYLSARGRQVMREMKNASIFGVAGYRDRWRDLALPQYPEPASVPIFARHANKLILGRGGAPTVPLMVYQGMNGTKDNPGNKPGIGPGDGIVVGGDTRELMRVYCAAGTPVRYREFDGYIGWDPADHNKTAEPWSADSVDWINDRFAARTAPSNCGSIRPGNSLAPMPEPPDPEPQPQDPAPQPQPQPQRPSAPQPQPARPIPAPSQPSPPAPPTSQKPRLVGAAAPAGSATNIRSRRRTVLVDLMCLGPAGTRCRIEVTVGARQGGVQKRVARVTVTVAAGSRRTVRVRPGRSGRRVLGRSRGRAAVVVRQGSRRLAASRLTLR